MVNFDSHTFAVAANIFTNARHELRPVVHQCVLERGCDFCCLSHGVYLILKSRGLDETGSHFRLEKKKLIKQDALKAHAQSGFQETTMHIRDTAKVAQRHTTMNRLVAHKQFAGLSSCRCVILASSLCPYQ